MRIVFFVSGGGGNLKAGLQLQTKRPDLIEIRMVVSDRLRIPAIDIASQAGIPVLAADFEARCGRWPQCKHDPVKASEYKQAAEAFHDWVLEEILEEEQRQGKPFDLAVLSYRRLIHGKLFAYFQERMINQHAGDLTVRCADRTRRYVGVNPVLKALRAGQRRTRTSTILVREGMDAGEILVQGFWTPYLADEVTKGSAYEHELVQKRESDWPAIKFALHEIAQGHYSLAARETHEDGCKVVYHRGKPLPYGGVDLAEDKDLRSELFQ